MAVVDCSPLIVQMTWVQPKAAKAKEKSRPARATRVWPNSKGLRFCSTLVSFANVQNANKTNASMQKKKEVTKTPSLELCLSSLSSSSNTSLLSPEMNEIEIRGPSALGSASKQQDDRPHISPPVGLSTIYSTITGDNIETSTYFFPVN